MDSNHQGCVLYRYNLAADQRSHLDQMISKHPVHFLSAAFHCVRCLKTSGFLSLKDGTAARLQPEQLKTTKSQIKPIY